jgi:hypothetical protein
MTKSLCVSVNSYWSSRDMKPTTSPLSLFTHDLKVRSSGSYGRDLLERLDDYCLDLLGTEEPLQFARALQDRAPGPRHVLEELLEWTSRDNDFLLIALVALSPDLESIALRLSWGRPSKDTISEVLTQATVALRWTEELVEGERVDFVLEHALSKTRNEQRRMSRHNVTTTFIPDDYDMDEPEVEPFEVAPSLLSRAEANRVICREDAELIRKTRGEKVSLQNLADESGTSYDGLRMRRARAEDRLRRRFRTTDLR